MTYYKPPDSDDEDEFDFQTSGGRDGIIFVIDANAEMFEENESNPAKFRSCLECIESSMKNTIITSEKDLVGVIFYNTKNSPKPKNILDSQPEIVVPKHCSIYIPMSTISKTIIESLINLNNSDDLHDFSTVYGHSDVPASISDVLWLCSRMITRCDYKLQTSTIVLFTNNDQPHTKTSNEFQQSLIRANDLLNSYITFVLVRMCKEFNAENFYDEIYCKINETDETHILTPEILLSRIYCKDYRKHCFRHLKMSIGGDILLGVGLYTCTKSTKYPKTVKLLRATNEPIIAKQSYLMGEYDEETAEMKYEKRLLPSEMRKSQFIGNEKIMFTAEETSEMKSLMEPGIRLLGFKPKSKLSLHHYLSKAYFLFYDETLIKGSAVLFRAIWEKCLDKDKVAFCVLSLRRKSKPKYVALLPQTETYANDVISKPNGFIVVELPCEGNIRNIGFFENTEPVQSSDEKIEICEKIIKKIRFRFDPNQFENPTIKHLYNHIEANIFEQSTEIEFEDNTLPDIEHQNNKIQPFLDNLTEIFGSVNIAEGVSGTSKRLNTDENSGPRTKSSKVAVINDNVNPEEVLNAVRDGTADKYSVLVLKNYLQSVGAKGISKLTKPNLINKIKEYI